MLKKRIISFMLAGMMVVSMTACGGEGKETTTSKSNQEEGTDAEEKEPVKLTFWNAVMTDIDDTGTYEKEEIAFYKSMERFKEAYPYVEVEVVRYGVEEMNQLLTAAAMSEELPDVIATWAGSYTNNFKDMLAPLEDYMSEEEVSEYTCLDICREDMRPDGKLQALPLGVTTYNVYYNKDIFQKYNIDENNLPETWEDFLNLCQTLKDGGEIPVQVDNSGSAEAWVLSEFFADELGPEKLIGLSDGTIKFDSDLYEELYGAWKQIFYKGYTNEDFRSIDGATTGQRFFNGESAMLFGGSWNQKDLMETMGDKVGTFKIPAYSADSPYKDYMIGQPGTNIAVMESSDCKEEAVAFAKMFSDGEYQTDDCAMFGNVPSNVKADASKLTNPLTQISYEWISADKNLIGFDSLINAEAAAEFYKNCVLVNTGEMTIREFGALLDSLVAK